MAHKAKKIVFYFIAALLVFAAGFFARGLPDRKRISGADGHYQGIQIELRNAGEAHSRIEGSVGGARSGVAASLELSGAIGSGLDGVESLAVENTGLLGRAERILLDAGARERGP
ncbi:MAG: hypothetical protein LBH43_10630, partial [Treponema sp.]|nr:hypothetical protein [Treponema sp.]